MSFQLKLLKAFFVGPLTIDPLTKFRVGFRAGFFGQILQGAPKAKWLLQSETAGFLCLFGHDLLKCFVGPLMTDMPTKFCVARTNWFWRLNFWVNLYKVLFMQNGGLKSEWPSCFFFFFSYGFLRFCLYVESR